MSPAIVHRPGLGNAKIEKETETKLLQMLRDTRLRLVPKQGKD